MNPLKLAIASGAFVLIISLLQPLFLRLFNKYWWQIKWVRRLSLLLVGYCLIAIAIFVFGAYQRNYELINLGALLATTGGLLSISLALAYCESGIVVFIGKIFSKWRHRKSINLKPQSTNRRQFLQTAVTVFPATALAFSGVGITKSFTGAEIKKVNLKYDNLPEDLNGFKILHVSDTHLGPFIDLDDLEDIMQRAQKHQPDLLLITGDIADHLQLLPDAIKLFEQLNATYGAYACMGNHDYYRGEQRVRRAFDKSSIPMLTNQGVTIKHNQSSMFIGGADDPRFMGRDISNFMRTTVDKTISQASSNDFKIIMSHRPTGFIQAAHLNVNLTLAGHTHGAQVGFMGRSLFENWGQEKYIWGNYKHGDSQIYTSCGVGHWFPFRLGCPTEAPLITLKKA